MGRIPSATVFLLSVFCVWSLDPDFASSAQLQVGRAAVVIYAQCGHWWR